MYFSLFPQDGSSLPIAIKTCKDDDEAERFLEEACKCEMDVVRMMPNSTLRVR